MSVGIGYILPTIGEYMFVEFMYWYWIYSANNWGIYVKLNLYISIGYILPTIGNICKLNLYNGIGYILPTIGDICQLESRICFFFKLYTF